MYRANAVHVSGKCSACIGLLDYKLLNQVCSIDIYKLVKLGKKKTQENMTRINIEGLLNPKNILDYQFYDDLIRDFNPKWRKIKLNTSINELFYDKIDKNNIVLF